MSASTTPSTSAGSHAAAGVSQLESSLPFFAAAILLSVGAVCAHVAGKRIRERYVTGHNLVPARNVTAVITPQAVGNAVDYAIDGAQILGLLLAPTLALSLNYGRVAALVRGLYIGAAIAAFVTALLFLATVKPATYGDTEIGFKIKNRLVGLKRRGWLTPVTQVGLVLNLALAIYLAVL